MQLCQYPCQNKVRRFTLEAIQIPIVYNPYGDYDPNGLSYVLEQDSQRIQNEAFQRFHQTPPQPYEEVQPLVLRVNRGDTVQICFRNRLKRDGRIWKVFSSKIHGDPATPVWKAYSGDRVIFRTMMPADKPRNVSLAIHGHLWREQPDDALSREIPIQGGISIGNRFDMELKDGASCPGDYLYRSGSFGWDVESGMWGIFRVMKQSLRCKCKEVGGKLPFHFGGNKTSLMIQSIKKQKKKEKHRGR